MGILSRLFGGVHQSAAVVVLERDLPHVLPEEIARIVDAILSKAGVRVSRRAHTVLMSGSRDQSRAIIAKVCEHYFSETLGSGYDENRLTITQFDYPEAGTGGVVVSHP
jgi:hypothetical protein